MKFPICFLFLGLLGCTLFGFARAQPAPHSYRIQAVGTNTASEKWCDYLRAQLERRMGNNHAALNTSAQPSVLDILIGLDTSLTADYAIQRTGNRLTLQAENEEVMLWMIYQCISWLAEEDSRIAAADLPPALTDMRLSSRGNFRFEYRGIYSPSNMQPEARAILATHNVDDDWGLWGHNLRKALGNQSDESLYALHDGRRDESQFCFSSETLYHGLESYILDNYGDGVHGAGARSFRFCIMPDDNDRVCQCSACRRAGNTLQSATGAVDRLLRRLAERFPRHLFFTTAYRTTAEAPDSPMPANCGVLVSAIDLPLHPLNTQEKTVSQFERKLAEWKRVTSRIYVWDYMRNFDDYLTPFPMLGTIKQRLTYFAQNGVSGIFFNGSGYDYASLDDVQTYVLSALLLTDRVDINTLTRRYLRRFYPQSADILYPYLATLEQRVADKRTTLPYYGGIEESIAAFLNPTELAAFVASLSRRSKGIEGEERTRLNRLLTALNFTMLELMRTPQGLPYDSLAVENALYDLQGHTHFADMTQYREANGTLESYLAAWHRHAVRSTPPPGSIPHPITCYGAEQQPVTRLSNRYYGLPTDYHTEWYVFRNGTLTAETRFTRNTTALIRANFLYAPAWRIDLPDSVRIFLNDKPILESRLPAEPTPFSTSVFRTEQSVSAGDRLKIIIVPNRQSGRSTACDEIEIYEKE